MQKHKIFIIQYVVFTAHEPILHFRHCKSEPANGHIYTRCFMCKLKKYLKPRLPTLNWNQLGDQGRVQVLFFPFSCCFYSWMRMCFCFLRCHGSVTISSRGRMRALKAVRVPCCQLGFGLRRWRGLSFLLSFGGRVQDQVLFFLVCFLRLIHPETSKLRVISPELFQILQNWPDNRLILSV